MAPGLLLAWPYLIDEVIRVPVKRVHEMPLRRADGTPVERPAIASTSLGRATR